MPAPPTRWKARPIPLGPAFIDFTMLEPLGVTAHIVPWNFPLGMAMRSLAPALAAGCTAVLKPAEQSPLSALAFAEIAADRPAFRRACINVVTGFGEEAGEALVRHPLVRGVTFTGSVETGREVMAAAARGIKPVVLELGGKNPMIVFADADLDRAVEDAVDGAFGNCRPGLLRPASRLLVEAGDPRRVPRAARGARRQHHASGRDSMTAIIGPLVSAEQHAKVTGYIADGRARRRAPAAGGGRPAHLDRGYFVAPTIFDRRRSRHAHRARRGLRAGAVAMRFRQRGRGGGARQRPRLRPRRRRLHARISRALAPRAAAGSRLGVDQRLVDRRRQQAPTGGIKESGIGRERGLPASATICRSRTSGSGSERPADTVSPSNGVKARKCRS